MRSYGYNIKEACKALELSRSTFSIYRNNCLRLTNYSKEKRGDNLLIERIKGIKLQHPFWGYRRISAWLKHREGLSDHEEK